jgi:hypothetical protein
MPPDQAPASSTQRDAQAYSAMGLFESESALCRRACCRAWLNPTNAPLLRLGAGTLDRTEKQNRANSSRQQHNCGASVGNRRSVAALIIVVIALIIIIVALIIIIALIFVRIRQCREN